MSGDTKKSCPELNSEQAIEWAKNNDLIVRIPLATELFLDIDTPHDRRTFDQNRSLVEAVYKFENVEETRSRSGKIHIVVTLDRPVSQITRIALQAVLGSDLRREAHSIRRFRQGELHPTLFFEKPTYMGSRTNVETYSPDGDKQ